MNKLLATLLISLTATAAQAEKIYLTCLLTLRSTTTAAGEQSGAETVDLEVTTNGSTFSLFSNTKLQNVEVDNIRNPTTVSLTDNSDSYKWDVSHLYKDAFDNVIAKHATLNRVTGNFVYRYDSSGKAIEYFSARGTCRKADMSRKLF